MGVVFHLFFRAEIVSVKSAGSGDKFQVRHGFVHIKASAGIDYVVFHAQIQAANEDLAWFAIKPGDGISAGRVWESEAVNSYAKI